MTKRPSKRVKPLEQLELPRGLDEPITGPDLTGLRLSTSGISLDLLAHQHGPYWSALLAGQRVTVVVSQIE